LVKNEHTIAVGGAWWSSGLQNIACDGACMDRSPNHHSVILHGSSRLHSLFSWFAQCRLAFMPSHTRHCKPNCSIRLWQRNR